jgi:uncharacterized membrane protein YkoI
MSKIIAIAVVCAMVFGTGSTLGSFVTSFDKTTPPSNSIDITFPDGGGSSVAASITMPSIAVGVGSKLTISSGPANESHFTDYRKEKDYSMKYTGNYYHDFPPPGSDYSTAEMAVNKNGASLKHYVGTYNPNFGEWGFIDNATTTANYLVDDGWDGRVVSGHDQSKTVLVPGPGAANWDCQGCSSAAKKSGSQSKTYYYDGKLFKTATARADYNSLPYGSYYAPHVTVKGWNINIQNWDTLVNDVVLADGAHTDTVFYTGSWATPKYSQIQVKISVAYAWDPYYAGFEFQGTTQGFMTSSTFTSLGVDAAVDNSMDKGWKAWNPAWNIYNATLIPDETKPGAGQDVTYFMSADNGTHWEQVTRNVTYDFQYSGHILRWKAVLTTNSDTASFAINTLDIRFNRLYSMSQTLTAPKFNSKWPIQAIKPQWNGSRSSATDILVSVSNNNGTTWKPVTNGAWAALPWLTDEGVKSTELRWKAELISDGKATPMLINITIVYIQSMFPMNVKIRVGDLPDPLWTHTGYFLAVDGTQDIDGNQLVIDLNYILPHLEQGMLTIPFNITSDSAGVIKLSALSVEFGLPPVLSQEIPAQKVDEDSGTHTKLVDLETYFTDDFDDGKMSFEIPFQEDPAKVKGWIEEKHYFSIEVMKKDWFGQVRFVVRAIDSAGLKTQSNTFTVSVENMNDPPALQQLPDFTLTVGQLFEYQLGWSDPDPDTWTFSMSPSVLNLDLATGKISTSPTAAQIGSYSVTYTITDKAGASDSKHGMVNISNKNTAPKLNTIGPQFLTVNAQFKLQVTATDPDLEYKTEALTYTLKFEEGAQTPKDMKIDAKTGMLTWTPTTPGSYWATVLVADKSGASDSEFVTFTVDKVNTAPRDLKILSPGDGTSSWDTTSLIPFEANAIDDDLGDKVTYIWYDGETQFGVGPSFRTVLTTPGVHTIKVVATDGKKYPDLKPHEVTATVKITVTQATPPTIKTTPQVASQNMLVSLLPLFVLLGAVIAVIVVATIYGRGGATRRKLKQLEDELKGLPPQGQAPPK